MTTEQEASHTRELHPRAFKVGVGWTLLLLALGSVVHATESSLACPDWPTCFGTMVPEMTGGVFWEHLHRLVAGGLVLMWLLATWLARSETTDRPWIYRASLAGIGLLVVQSVLGGVTVVYRLPDLVSTAHLGLAFGFLVLATVLATRTHRYRRRAPVAAPPPRLTLYAGIGAGLVFVQSLLGALVRHKDAGMACPDVPLCLGQVVPPLVASPIVVHWLHRVLALVVVAALLGLALWARSAGAPAWARRRLDTAAGLGVLQAGLGVLSVLSVLAVPPVVLHTAVAATLLALLTHTSALDPTHTPAPAAEPAPTVPV